MDEDFCIIGAKAFDGPVTDIRYAGGTYYATVDGWSTPSPDRLGAGPGRAASTYSGTAWYKQENQRKPVEVTSYLIREQPGNNGPLLAVSTDGYSWLPLETKLTPDMMRLSETGGGAVVYYSPYDGSLYYYDYRGSRFAGACTAGWVEADLGFDPPRALERLGGLYLPLDRGRLSYVSVCHRPGDDGYRRRPVQPEQQQGHFLGSQLPPDGGARLWRTGGERGLCGRGVLMR